MSKKKKGEKESSPPTTVSSPIRGANQDQSGYGVKHSTANYTISDETQYDEGFVAGIGSVRATPIQMNTTPRGKQEKNAPRNIGAMQHAADKRRMQLDRIAQKRSQVQKRNKEKTIASRQHDESLSLTNLAQKVGKESKTKMPKDKVSGTFLKFSDFVREEIEQENIVSVINTHEETIDIDEARRGRPRKGEGEDQESSNIIMQLRKVISLRGQAPVRFLDGKQSMMSPATAHRLLSVYDNLKTSGEKHSFAERIHKSAESLRDTLAGKKEVAKPKITLAGKFRG